MRNPILLAAALLLLIGSWQPVQAQFPCTCRSREYENLGDGTSTYFALYHEEDCENFMVIFVQENEALPEQTCPECDPTFMKVKNLAAAKDKSQPSEVNVLKKKPAQPKQKKKKDFVPTGGGFEAKPFLIVRFWLQGEQEACYVKLFNVKHFDDPDTDPVETGGDFNVGFEIDPVPNGDVDLKYNFQDSLTKVRSLKLKHPDEGTIVVPQQYVVKVGEDVEYNILATR